MMLVCLFVMLFSRAILTFWPQVIIYADFSRFPSLDLIVRAVDTQVSKMPEQFTALVSLDKVLSHKEAILLILQS